MRVAAVAGVSPGEFERLSLAQVQIAIEAYRERERQTLISRVSAVLRGLSQLNSKNKSDPYQGLFPEKEKAKANSVSWSPLLAQAFGGKPKMVDAVKAAFARLK